MNKKGVSAKNYIITDIALKILSSSYLKKSPAVAPGTHPALFINEYYIEMV